MNAIFVVLLALIGISSVVADLSGFWSASDLNRLVKSHQKTLASSSSSSKDIYYSLQLLSVSQNVDSFCQCDVYGHRVSVAASLVEKYHAVKSNDLCNCNFKPSNELLAQIEDSLQVCSYVFVISCLFYFFLLISAFICFLVRRLCLSGICSHSGKTIRKVDLERSRSSLQQIERDRFR